MCKRKSIFFILITIIIASSIFLATGCSKNSEKNSGNKEISLDEKSLATDLLEKVKFSAEMTEIAPEALEFMYTIEEGTTGILYQVGGQLADEITIFTAKDEASAKKMLENVKKYIEERKKLFASYAPAEVVKLEKAVLVQKGKYVVFCVTSDVENAKTIIDKAF